MAPRPSGIGARSSPPIIPDGPRYRITFRENANEFRTGGLAVMVQ
jgi:hypothetical protein